MANQSRADRKPGRSGGGGGGRDLLAGESARAKESDWQCVHNCVLMFVSLCVCVCRPQLCSSVSTRLCACVCERKDFSCSLMPDLAFMNPNEQKGVCDCVCVRVCQYNRGGKLQKTVVFTNAGIRPKPADILHIAETAGKKVTNEQPKKNNKNSTMMPEHEI